MRELRTIASIQIYVKVIWGRLCSQNYFYSLNNTLVSDFNRLQVLLRDFGLSIVSRANKR